MKKVIYLDGAVVLVCFPLLWPLLRRLGWTMVGDDGARGSSCWVVCRGPWRRLCWYDCFMSRESWVA
eukprot:scaffold249373_cov118-Cyclotella_meneghiniana.AAC.5